VSDLPQTPSNSRYQILALSGGGYRGLYTASFLEDCETTYNAACKDKFDLIAGTSIGALLAAGLSLGVSAKALKLAMLKHGPLIFEQKRLAFLNRFFLKAPYETKVLRDAIEEVLGNDAALMPLSEVDAPLLILTVNYTTGASAILASRGVAGQAASQTPVVDAILASAAAPTFFPLKKTGTDQFADGGLIANAPDMVALIDCIATKRATLEDIYMLSIGTAGRREGAAVHSVALNPSILSWFFYRGLIQTTMAAQEDLALAQASALLGDRHLRIDREPAKKQVASISSLDKADGKATDTLESLAKATFDDFKANRKLRAFF
jgi:patatin-like phospholipase/acyl hydrolase